MATIITTAEGREHYIPGACNIGEKEVQFRRRSFFITAIVLVVVIILLQVTHTSHTWRLLLFPVLAGLILNGQQIYFRFCVMFGAKGVFNFDEVGRVHTVEQKEYARLDRIKAWRMIISSTIIALVLTVLYYFLPV